MNTKHDDFNNVNLQKIYFPEDKHQKYEIVSYLTKSGITEEYVIGRESILPDKQDAFANFGSYEWFLRFHRPAEGFEMLHDALYFASEVSNDLINDPEELKKTKNIVLEFCTKYGLNSDELPTNSDLRGFKLYPFIYRLLDLLTVYEDFEILNSSRNFNEFNKRLLVNPWKYAAQINVVSLLSPDEQTMKLVAFSNSVIDIAFYQLGKVRENSLPIKKCANPACTRLIINGRANKKTCSNACRKAYERSKKNQGGL